MINIKEILLAGGRVSLSYKEDKEECMGRAEIYSLSGGFFDLKPKIVVLIYTSKIEGGRKNFQYNDLEIEKAILLFESIVFNLDNLCYKQHEAIINLNCELDLDENEDYQKMETERLRLIQL